MDISEKELASRINEINPRRGEVYEVEIIDAEGYEQKGNEDDKRLVVVVSNNQQNVKKNVIVIVPLSSKVKKIYPFQVSTFFQGKPDKAKCEQVRAIIAFFKINVSIKFLFSYSCVNSHNQNNSWIIFLNLFVVTS